MLQAKADALVNTVNTVGVMGKGIALQFKEAFPHNYKTYKDACDKKELKPGQLLAVWDNSLLYGKKLIVNFPTKEHWRSPSRLEHIEQGLIALQQLIADENIQSIAVPPLGCGNGGLDWNEVKPLIIKYLEHLHVEVLVYEPNAHIKAVLQQQEVKKDIKLTTARAQLLYALFAYEGMGEHCSLFAANKLAYFLQKMGQPLKLDFIRHFYGPYAVGVEKVLYALNGIYLKGYEQQEAKAFEPLKLNYEKWPEINEYCQKEMNEEERKRLNNLLKLLDGFSSEFSLEILATTSFILDKHPNYTVPEVMIEISSWNERKNKLFKEEHVQLAYDHLIKHRELYSKIA